MPLTTQQDTTSVVDGARGRLTAERVARAVPERVLLAALAIQRDRAKRLAPVLRATEHAFLQQTINEIHRLEGVRRFALERLRALDAGAHERFPREAYCARQALDAVAYDLPHAVAAWMLLALAPPDLRMRFTAHPEQREQMVSRVLRLRGLSDQRGRWRELEAFL